MIILVDADGVMENLCSEMPKLINEKYGTNVEFEDITQWDFAKAFPQLTHEQIYSVEFDERLYERMRPMDRAPEYLEQLIKDGHEVYIVTNTPYKALTMKMEIVIQKYFPFIGWDHCIITGSKHMIKGDIIIDDGIHNLINSDCIKLLFDAPYNRYFDAEANGMMRVRTWEEIYNAVNDIQNTLNTFMLEANAKPSEVRLHSLVLARQLLSQIKPIVDGQNRTLFVFILRGAMLLYPPFANEFKASSIAFIYSDSLTKVDCTDYDTVVIIDTLINSGKTLFNAKKILQANGIKAKQLCIGSIIANAELKEKLESAFDKIVCLNYVDYLNKLVDVGQFYACGDGMITEKTHTAL